MVKLTKDQNNILEYLHNNNRISIVDGDAMPVGGKFTFMFNMSSFQVLLEKGLVKQVGGSREEPVYGLPG